MRDKFAAILVLRGHRLTNRDGVLVHPVLMWRFRARMPLT
jgi:hypothetical protein